MIDADLKALLAWIAAGSGNGDPPFDQITTMALTAQAEDMGLIDVHGDLTPAGREAIGEESK